MTDEEKKERRRQYNREYRRKYYKANREKCAATVKKWKDSNLDKVAAYKKEWRAENIEHVKTTEQNYRQVNKDHFFIKGTKLRALSFNKLHPQHNVELERSFYILAKNCEAVFNEPFEVDHILPYDCGGWHHHENLQVIPARINRQKQNNPDYQSNWPNFKTWRDLPEFLIAEKNF